MHIQFMIEDSSSAALIEVLMEKLKDSVSLLTYDVKHFHGIGGFTRKNTVKEIKTGKLLNDLATYLRGFSKSLQGIQAAIFVIVDNDDRDTAEFRLALERLPLKTISQSTECSASRWKRWRRGCWGIKQQSTRRILWRKSRCWIAMNKTVFAEHGKFWRKRFIRVVSET